MLYNFFFALILICFTSNHMLAQQVMTDVVYLKDGTIIRGQVLEYSPKGEIKIEAVGGSIVVYESSRVVKIKKETPTILEIKSKKRSLHIKKNGWYNSFAFGNVIALNTSVSPLGFSPLDLLGFQLEYSIGYQLNQYLGLGLNVSLFGAGSDGTIPISANFRGYFMKTSASLYYDLNIGYGFSIT